MKPGKNLFSLKYNRDACGLWRAAGFGTVLAVVALITFICGIPSTRATEPSNTNSHQEAVRPVPLVWSNLAKAVSTSRAADLSSQNITVKKVAMLGPQNSVGVTNVSRDGGSSVLLNGKIVWLYDDTASRNSSGGILSFLSNTAAYSSESNGNVTLIKDFGVVLMDQNDQGKLEAGILAENMIQNGGWIPFTKQEVEVNKKDPLKERVAIWPGTAPTPVNDTCAILFAPLVKVYGQARNFSREYQAKGMTLISIIAPDTGPEARREADLVVPEGQIPFGGFSTLIGDPNDAETLGLEDSTDAPPKVLYMFGIANHGLQLARALLSSVTDFKKWTFFDTRQLRFVNMAPTLDENSTTRIYMPGSFSSGNIFYNPHYGTFFMVYFNNHGDSTFYLRYLDLARPLGKTTSFTAPLKAWQVEALTQYHWSKEQVLYVSPVGESGDYNYAGTVHTEFFNQQYYGSLHNEAPNPWYGIQVAPESNRYGSHLMLSWTSQVHGGANTGVYQIMMAAIELNDLTDPRAFYGPTSPSTAPASTTAVSTAPLPTSTTSSVPIPESHSGAGRLYPDRIYWNVLWKLGLMEAAVRWLAWVIWMG